MKSFNFYKKNCIEFSNNKLSAILKRKTRSCNEPLIKILNNSNAKITEISYENFPNFS